MKIEKLRSKLKKVFNRVMGVLLPVATLFVSCNTNALVVHAEESNSFHATGSYTYEDYTYETDINVTASSNYEIIAHIGPTRSNGIVYYRIFFSLFDKSNKEQVALEGNCTNIGTYRKYYKGKLQKEYSMDDYYQYSVPYKSVEGSAYTVSNFSLTGNVKLFKDNESLMAYVKSGDTSGMIEVKGPENEKNWYLKNVSYKVTADDSPSSEAGADATYIHFSWDTDNLQDGDLLEIKTYNYYKKILGEKLSGFHDFVTYSDGVAASSGKYSFSQYTATKAWFNSLENKPLAFKEYDTTDYYLRPVRMGTLGVEKYGGWVHIKMGRSTPTSSPYIEDIEYGNFDDDNNWTVDEDLTDKNGGHHGVDQGGGYIPPDQSDNPFTGTNIAGIFSYFYDFMKQIPAMLGDLPALVGNIISFLPKPIIAFIGIGVLVAIILRIVGR